MRLQSIESNAKKVRRRRAKAFPSPPKDLHFTIDYSGFPNGNNPRVLRDDIPVGTKGVFNEKGEEQFARHLIFATDRQLEHLQSAKRLHVDGTFKLVGKPFYQLLGIHTYIKSGDRMKLIPVAFVDMSRRRAIDYIKVFRSLKKLAPNMKVEEIVSDFERGLWKAVRRVFPDVSMRGCAFHFTQSVFKRIKRLGLSGSYKRNKAVHRLCRKLMTLHLLPYQKIPRVFKQLSRGVTSLRVISLLKY